MLNKKIKEVLILNFNKKVRMMIYVFKICNLKIAFESTSGL